MKTFPNLKILNPDWLAKFLLSPELSNSSSTECHIRVRAPRLPAATRFLPRRLFRLARWSYLAWERVFVQRLHGTPCWPWRLVVGDSSRGQSSTRPLCQRQVGRHRSVRPVAQSATCSSDCQHL